MLFQDNRAVQLTIADSKDQEQLDYSPILKPEENIRQLLPCQIAELEDYLRGKRTYEDFTEIRSNWVTTRGGTIWQLCIRLREVYPERMPDIASDQPPISFIRWILKLGQ